MTKDGIFRLLLNRVLPPGFVAARRRRLLPKQQKFWASAPVPALAYLRGIGLAAVTRLNEILRLTEAVVLDRGDLAGEIGMENLPEAQDRILLSCRRNQVKVIVATQLLKSMQEQRILLIPELTEICRLLEMGIYGLQLSEETAVGQLPKECVDLILSMSHRIAARA